MTVIEIGAVRAPNPYRDKWVFTEFAWAREEQKCCVHGIELRRTCGWCQGMEQEIATKEGRKAHAAGRVRETCPYGVSAYDISHHAWCLGWDTAYTEENNSRRKGSP